MRHLKAGRRLGRNAEQRLALFRNLTMALIQHGRIVTTLAKAKAVRPFVEKIITLARRSNSLHARRLALARLGPMGYARPDIGNKKEDKADRRTIVNRLFEDIAPRFRDCAGGYTRIIKLQTCRLGDAGPTAILELIPEGEVKRPSQKTSASVAPAPVVAPPSPEPVAETPTPAPESTSEGSDS